MSATQFVCIDSCEQSVDLSDARPAKIKIPAGDCASRRWHAAQMKLCFEFQKKLLTGKLDTTLREVVVLEQPVAAEVDAKAEREGVAIIDLVEQREACRSTLRYLGAKIPMRAPNSGNGGTRWAATWQIAKLTAEQRAKLPSFVRNTVRHHSHRKDAVARWLDVCDMFKGADPLGRAPKKRAAYYMYTQAERDERTVAKTKKAVARAAAVVVAKHGEGYLVTALRCGKDVFALAKECQ